MVLILISIFHFQLPDIFYAFLFFYSYYLSIIEQTIITHVQTSINLLATESLQNFIEVFNFLWNNF